MWIAITRPPLPDASYWPGRCMLALLDAIVWPALLFAVISALSVKTGVAGLVIQASLGLFALRRARLALFCNKRYRFTTARWGAPLASLIALGALMKVCV